MEVRISAWGKHIKVGIEPCKGSFSFFLFFFKKISYFTDQTGNIFCQLKFIGSINCCLTCLIVAKFSRELMPN